MAICEVPIRVGVVGLGRSGWNIHVNTMRQMPDKFRIVAVMDPYEQQRRDAAQLGCPVYDKLEPLLAQKDVDVVSITSPNYMHTPQALAAFAAGKHVICEKVVALNLADFDRMVEASKRAGKIFAPFHNNRYAPHLAKVKEIIASGKLGQIIQIGMCWHSFGRRWDWQTLTKMGGGSLNNPCAHAVDQVLQIFDHPKPDVFCDVRHTLACGDAEDHVKIVLRGQGCPTVDLEVTSCCAYPQDYWRIMGTAGGLHGSNEKLDWKWVDWNQVENRQADDGPAANRSYNFRDDLVWQQDSWDGGELDYGLMHQKTYEGFYGTFGEGKPLFITPESVRRQIAILEVCHKYFAEHKS